MAGLGPRSSILLLHGEADRVLQPINSAEVYRWAGEPKRIITYPGAGHSLTEAAEDVFLAVQSWIRERLGSVPG